MQKIWNARHRHYGDHAVIAFLALGLLVRPATFLGAVHAPLTMILSTGIPISVIVAFRHLRGPLCEQCIAAMPLDPQTRVDRAKPLLRFMHLLIDGGGHRIAFVAPLIGFYFTAAWLPLLMDVPYSATLAAYEMLTLYMLVMSIARQLHYRYEPWCPYCRRGGGDEARENTTPPAVPQPA
jgi:hypothetical protein